MLQEALQWYRQEKKFKTNKKKLFTGTTEYGCACLYRSGPVGGAGVQGGNATTQHTGVEQTLVSFKNLLTHFYKKLVPS